MIYRSTRRIATTSIFSIDRYIQRQCIANNAHSPIRSLLKSFTSFAPQIKIVFTESNISSRSRTRGKKKPNEWVVGGKREKKKPRREMKKDVREKDNGRGNGKWHDAMRSEGSYTHLSFFIRAGHLRHRRWCCEDWIRRFAKRNTVLLSPLSILRGWERGERTGERTYSLKF